MKNLTGKYFGKWKVISFDRRDGKNYFWNVECECGTKKSTNIGLLRSGQSKSCGCGFNKGKTTHNMSKTKFYRVFCFFSLRKAMYLFQFSFFLPISSLS